MRPRDTQRLDATLRRWRESRMAFLEDLILDDGRRLGDALTSWQRDMLQGIHTHDYSYIELPRGSGKTTLAAAEVAASLFLDKPGSRIYAAAADRDQAGILHELAAGFIERSAILRQSAQIEKWRILILSTKSRLETLAADAPSSHGLIPDLIVSDELSVWLDPELWHALWSAAGKRRAKVIVISTPGSSPAHWSKRVRDLAVQSSASGGRWFYAHRGAPPEWVDPEWIAEQRRTLPPEVFARLHEAKWVQGGGSAITQEDVAAVFDRRLRRQNRGAPGVAYVVALDIGLVKDRTVITVGHRDEAGRFIIDRMEVFEGSADARVRFSDIESALLRLHEAFHAPTFTFDVWQALNLSESLKRRGLRIHEFKFTSETRHRLDANLLRLVKDRQLAMYTDTPESDLLRNEMLALEVKLTPTGWRFDHVAGRHDDCWVSVGMAALTVPQIKPEPWCGRLELPRSWETGFFESDPVADYLDISYQRFLNQVGRPPTDGEYERLLNAARVLARETDRHR